VAEHGVVELADSVLANRLGGVADLHRTPAGLAPWRCRSR
jgi:hypothetical protein